MCGQKRSSLPLAYGYRQLGGGRGSASRATRATWSCFSERGHKSAMSKEAEAIQGASTGPGARRPAF